MLTNSDIQRHKNRLEESGVGFQCKGCRITVLCDPDRIDLPQIPARLCTACFERN